MPIHDFLRLCFKNSIAAFLAWFLCALFLEYIFPGFVAPFVNLVALGFLLVIGSVAVVALETKEQTRTKRRLGFFGCLVACVLIGTLALLVGGTSKSNLTLVGVSLCAAILFLKTLFLDTE